MSRVRLHDHQRAGEIVTDIAGQFLLEADARHDGLALERDFADGVLTYRFVVGIPGSMEERDVRVDLSPANPQPAVHADGPVCLRHRWSDGSLCMWDPEGPTSERWVLGDGLVSLVGHVQVHLFCEAACRAGDTWPKAEMAGDHPRKKDCQSCRGRGR
jgi:hypothetical protein